MEAVQTTPSKQGDTYGTRRNTRSTSNQDKDKDNSDGSKNGCVGKDQDSLVNDAPKKKQSERFVKAQNGDVLEYTTEDGVTYKPLDSAYLATERPDNPYYVCTIQEIKVSKRDNAVVSLKWYYRPTEVPDLVYQMLIKERYDQVEDPDVKELIMKPDIINRELFIDDREEASDSYPISCLRGKCEVVRYNSISEIKNFELRPDGFFCVVSYNLDTRRLASAKGETRVGPSHQWNASMRGIFQKAEVPDLLDPSERGYVNGRVYEEMTWEPKVNKCDLIMCLRAARSLAAFAGVCDGVSPEEGCIVASRDDTTINALRVLYENNGNTRKTIDALVKNPVPITIESKWTEDQVKRFQRGLRMFGKNFFKIKKELLSMKETGELVEFYYLWKKTQDSLMVRPHHRKHRRQAAMKTSAKQTGSNNGPGDQTSTEEEAEDSEESEKEVSHQCKQCQTSTSKEWLPGGKDGAILCSECRTLFKKYGETRPPIRVEGMESEDEIDEGTPPAAKNPLPSFLFKPIKEEKVVSNLIPRKPPKSLAKVNSPSVVKVRTEKPCKREWSDSEDVKSPPATLLAKFKRPKTEPEEIGDCSRANQDGSQRTAEPSETPKSEIKELMPECKPFSSPANSNFPPSIIPKTVASRVDAYPPNSQVEATSDPAKRLDTSLVKNLHSSIGGLMAPFISAGEGPTSAKPSELEAILKLAMSTGCKPRGNNPAAVVGYVGAGTPAATLSSQTTTSGQSTTLTYLLPGTTTVTTTSTVSSSPTVEPAGGQHSRSSVAETSGRSDTQDPINLHRSAHFGPHHSGGSSPRLRGPSERENSGQHHHAPKFSPQTAAVRNFPFDPCFSDQIISNANMPRMSVKEEVRVTSPRRPPDGQQLSRGSPALRHIKQEPHPNHQRRRPYSHPEPMPHQPFAGHQRPYPQNTNAHGLHRPEPSRHAGSASHPHLAPAGRPVSPRHGHPVQPQTRDRDDSDVELIDDARPNSPPITPDNKTLVSFGNSSRFLKVWNRGPNSCFRTDFVFSPDQASKQSHSRKLQEVKEKQNQSQPPAPSAVVPRNPSNPPPSKRPRTPSSQPSEQEKKREDKADSRRDRPSSALNQSNRSTPAQANAPRATPTRTPTSAYEQHRGPPSSFISPMHPFGSDTPALRQLQQYASIDMRRNAAAEAMGSVHPFYPYYQLGALSEAEARERELRERETLERLAKMGGDIKPQEMLDPHNPNVHPMQPMLAGLHMGSIPVSMAGQHLVSMEQQLQLRQYHAHLMNSLPPGTNPNSALAMAAASNFSPGMIPGGPFNPEPYAPERLSMERLQAERLAAEQYQMEVLRHHSHSHVHSHLHLHPPGQPGAPQSSATPLPLGVPHPPPGLAVADQLMNPYASAAMQAIHPFAAASASGNPLLSPMMRNQHAAAAQAALMQQTAAAAAAREQAAVAAAAREQAAAQPHPFSQNLQALHEHHVIEMQRARAAAVIQEQQFLAAQAQAVARYKQ